VADVVGAEGELEPALRDATLAGQTGVVDEDVQWLVARQERFGRVPHRRQVAQVEVEVDGAVADLVDDLLALLLGPGSDENLPPAPGQLDGRGPADAAVGTGDENALALQVLGVLRAHPTSCRSIHPISAATARGSWRSRWP